MENKVIHLAHCTYANSVIEYEWNKEIGADYHDLKNLYAITLIKKDGATRQALATLVVKTNLGQTQLETGKIFAAMANTFEKLKSLPTKDVSLISTEVNTRTGFIPTEDGLLTIITDMYVQNSVSGSA